MTLPPPLGIMNFRILLALAVAISTAAFFTACSPPQPDEASALSSYQSYDLPTSSPANPANVHVKVSLRKQRTYVMEGSKILLAMPVSIGSASTPTPRGNFKISEKDAKHRSATHGYATRGDQVKRIPRSKKPPGWSFKGTPMPYWCEFKPGYGFHTGWIKHTPNTDGCIRMHENLAPKFYNLVRIGTPVNIAYSQPEDETVGYIPLPPDAGPLPDYDSSMYLGDGYFTRHKSQPHR